MVACQAPLSMGFPRQKYWSGLPFSSPGDLPIPGIESASPALAGRFFTAEPPGKAQRHGVCVCVCVCVCVMGIMSRFEMHKWFEKNRRGMDLGRERANLGKIFKSLYFQAENI